MFSYDAGSKAGGESALKGLRVVVVGAGGAGKALAFGAIERGAEVLVCNRQVHPCTFFIIQRTDMVRCSKTHTGTHFAADGDFKRVKVAGLKTLSNGVMHENAENELEAALMSSPAVVK